jgi:HK97 family phage major capsid protein
MLSNTEIEKLRAEFGPPDQKPMFNNIHVAAGEKAKAREAAELICNVAQRENRGLTDAEAEEFDQHVSVIKAANKWIERHDRLGGITRGGYQGPVIHIPAGRSMGEGSEEFSDDLGAVGAWMQGKISAADTPLHISQSPVSPGLSTSIPTSVLDRISTYIQNDAFRLAGSTIYLTDNTDPLVKPIVSAGADADTFVEGQSASESHPFQVNSFVFGGTKYSRLVKVSEEALMNVAMDLPGEILAELGASVANTFTTAITAALVTALQGNSSTFVDNGADAYEAILNLIAAVPPRFEDPTNCFMGSRAMRLRIQNTRTTQGEPLLDPTTGTILGKRFVVNDNLTRLVYGNWAAGAFVRKSPFFLLKLIEAYHTEGAVGFKATQYLDSKFLSSVSAVTTQPLYFTHLEAEGS